MSNIFSFCYSHIKRISQAKNVEKQSDPKRFLTSADLNGCVKHLPVQMARLEVLRNSNLPLVTVRQQLLLVVQQLLVSLRRELKVWTHDDRIHGACLLAETAVDALGHVDIVPSRSAAAVSTRLSIDCDGLDVRVKLNTNISRTGLSQ